MSSVHPLPEPDKLVMLALELACWPTDPSRDAEKVLIPWSLIIEIRAECERRGISWRAIRMGLGERTRMRQRNWLLHHRATLR